MNHILTGHLQTEKETLTQTDSRAGKTSLVFQDSSQTPPAELAIPHGRTDKRRSTNETETQASKVTEQARPQSHEIFPDE
jgi:hypothetical protein